MPTTAIVVRTTMGGAVGMVRAAMAAKRPPMTTAPSPPMIIKPRYPGRAVQRAVSISGAARISVFCQENEVPKAARYIV